MAKAWIENGLIFITDDESLNIPNALEVPQGTTPQDLIIDNGSLRFKTEEEKIQPEPVPESITPRQFRLQLIEEGLDDLVADYINSLQDPILKKKIAVELEYSLTIKRNNPTLIQAATELGLSEAELDNIFRKASKL